MYVYLTSDHNVTFIGSAEEPAGCHVEEGWDLLMAMEVPSHMVHTVMNRWKRESRGAASRVNRGLKLANEFNLRIHVSAVPVGDLKSLNKFRSKGEGRPKDVPDSFWENL
jgi:hypothetical protein